MSRRTSTISLDTMRMTRTTKWSRMRARRSGERASPRNRPKIRGAIRKYEYDWEKCFQHKNTYRLLTDLLRDLVRLLFRVRLALFERDLERDLDRWARLVFLANGEAERLRFLKLALVGDRESGRFFLETCPGEGLFDGGIDFRSTLSLRARERLRLRLLDLNFKKKTNYHTLVGGKTISKSKKLGSWGLIGIHPPMTYHDNS